MKSLVSGRFPVPPPSPSLLRAILLTAALLTLTNPAAHAGSATWVGIPSGDWVNAPDWNPQTVPDGPDDVATFGDSDQTEVTEPGRVEVNSVVFQPGAKSFTVTEYYYGHLSFTGAGISNQSGQLQTFHISWMIFDEGENELEFYNSASAGQLTQFEVDGIRSGGGPTGGCCFFGILPTQGRR